MTTPKSTDDNQATNMRTSVEGDGGPVLMWGNGTRELRRLIPRCFHSRCFHSRGHSRGPNNSPSSFVKGTTEKAAGGMRARAAFCPSGMRGHVLRPEVSNGGGATVREPVYERLGWVGSCCTTSA